MHSCIHFNGCEYCFDITAREWVDPVIFKFSKERYGIEYNVEFNLDVDLDTVCNFLVDKLMDVLKSKEFLPPKFVARLNMLGNDGVVKLAQLLQSQDCYYDTLISIEPYVSSPETGVHGLITYLKSGSLSMPDCDFKSLLTMGLENVGLLEYLSVRCSSYDNDMLYSDFIITFEGLKLCLIEGGYMDEQEFNIQ